MKVMEGFSLDKNAILEYQRNRPPYLMVDYVTKVIPGVSANGYKDLTDEDWFFKCHFPGDPNMPGMLQIEALVQLCALTIFTLPGNKGKVMYLSSADKLKFKRKIVSGDRLEMKTELLSWRLGIGKCRGVGMVDGEVACRADFVIAMPDILEKLQVLS